MMLLFLSFGFELDPEPVVEVAACVAEVLVLRAPAEAVEREVVKPLHHLARRYAEPHGHLAEPNLGFFQFFQKIFFLARAIDVVVVELLYSLFVSTMVSAWVSTMVSTRFVS